MKDIAIKIAFGLAMMLLVLFGCIIPVLNILSQGLAHGLLQGFGLLLWFSLGAALMLTGAGVKPPF